MTAADVTPVVPADVTPVVQTVTVRGTEEEKGEDARTDRSTSTPGPSGRRSPPSQAGGRIGPNRATTRAEMGAALNPEVAYAERNIVISPSGKLTIGQELRTELREAFTDEQIDGALDCTLAPMGTNRNKVQILAQLRRQCTFKRENDKRPASGRPSTSKGVF